MALTALSPARSSWVRAIGYQKGYLAVFSDGWAWLFAGVPSEIPGLIAAGHVKEKSGDLSVGSAVHRLLKSKEYPRQKIQGEAALSQLREMMATGPTK